MYQSANNNETRFKDFNPKEKKFTDRCHDAESTLSLYVGNGARFLTDEEVYNYFGITIQSFDRDYCIDYIAVTKTREVLFIQERNRPASAMNYMDFTIRYRRSTGSRTEYHKIPRTIESIRRGKIDLIYNPEGLWINKLNPSFLLWYANYEEKENYRIKRLCFANLTAIFDLIATGEIKIVEDGDENYDENCLYKDGIFYAPVKFNQQDYKKYGTTQWFFSINVQTAIPFEKDIGIKLFWFKDMENKAKWIKF